MKGSILPVLKVHGADVDGKAKTVLTDLLLRESTFCNIHVRKLRASVTTFGSMLQEGGSQSWFRLAWPSVCDTLFCSFSSVIIVIHQNTTLYEGRTDQDRTGCARPDGLQAEL